MPEKNKNKIILDKDEIIIFSNIENQKTPILESGNYPGNSIEDFLYFPLSLFSSTGGSSGLFLL